MQIKFTFPLLNNLIHLCRVKEDVLANYMSQNECHNLFRIMILTINLGRGSIKYKLGASSNHLPLVPACQKYCKGANRLFQDSKIDSEPRPGKLGMIHRHTGTMADPMD